MHVQHVEDRVSPLEGDLIVCRKRHEPRDAVAVGGGNAVHDDAACRLEREIGGRDVLQLVTADVQRAGHWVSTQMNVRFAGS